MKKFTWAVMTNCDPEHQKEFNAWYDNVHIPDLLRIPGVVGAKRSRVADTQMVTKDDGSMVITDPAGAAIKYRYLALYNIETDDIAAVLQTVRSRANTSEMVLSEYLKEAVTIMYEEC